MRFSAIALLFSVGLVAAQTSTAYVPQESNTNPACSDGVEAIINSCLDSTTPQLEGCEANDWSCMCYAQNAILTCYNNCVADSRLFGAQQQQTQWCAAAKAYASTASTSTTVAPSTMATSASSMMTSSVGADTTTATSSAAQPSMTGNGAATFVAPAGGMMAVLLGAIAFL